MLQTFGCSCGGACTPKTNKEARFIVLGSCCKKSTQTFENVKEAVKSLGLSDEVVNIGDSIEIAKFGVMSTPGFVINKKVVSMGKALKVEDAVNLIKKAGIV